ncbi:MAG: hypothetical protein ACJAXY_000051 [Nonlabens sp.]|jgi:hypothetical protein
MQQMLQQNSKAISELAFVLIKQCFESDFHKSQKLVQKAFYQH